MDKQQDASTDTLTTEQMQSLVVSAVTGSEHTVKGAAAEKFLTGLQSDIETAKKAGYMISIPSEWPAPEATDGE